jgi:hypothetical protein
MKAILLISFSIFLSSPFFSCKKTVDKQKENYVLSVLTEGRWFLESYVENNIDFTYEFYNYEFQFYDNGRLDAILLATSSTTSGTWAGNVDNLTITVTFPFTNSQLYRLSKVWQWLGSNVGLVFAESVTATEKVSIRLRKK